MKKQTTYKTGAIVLRSYDIKEYDRLYVIFSEEHGLMRVVGVGTRKPKAKLASGLEPLTKSELFLVCCRGLDKVAGVLIHDQYKNIRADLESIANARSIFVLVEALAPELESAGEVYGLLDEFLDSQDQASAAGDSGSVQKQRLIKLAVVWKIIKWAGYEPHLFYCRKCHAKLEEKNEYEFLVPEGVVCEKCSKERTGERGVKIGKNTVKLLRFFSQKELSAISKIQVAEGIFFQTRKIINAMATRVARKGNIL